MHRSPPVVPWLSLTLALCVTVPAAQAAEEDDFIAMDRLTRTQITMVSSSGTAILADIDAARAAIEKKDWIRARTDVARARARLAEVRRVSPSARVQDRIHAALEDLTTSGVEKNEQTLMPIFRELDTAREVTELAEVRMHVHRAKGALDRGNVEEAREALVAASARVAYLEIDLPVEATQARLTRALIALRHKDLPRANTALREAQESVTGFMQVASRSVVAEELDVGAGPAE